MKMRRRLIIAFLISAIITILVGLLGIVVLKSVNSKEDTIQILKDEIGEFKKTIVNFRSAREEVFKEVKNGNYEKISILWDNKLKPAEYQYVKHLDNIVVIEKELIEDLFAANKKSMRNANILIILFLFIGIIVSLAFGLILSNSIFTSLSSEKIATEASEETINGEDIVNETVDSIKNIVDTIQIISDITNNTNVLALNAAAEIKNTATSSVKVANRAEELIEKVVPNIIKTSDMVREITTVTKEQKSGVKQPVTDENRQEQVAQTVSGNSQQLAVYAEEMAVQSQILLKIVNEYKIRANFLQRNSNMSNRELSVNSLDIKRITSP